MMDPLTEQWFSELMGVDDHAVHPWQLKSDKDSLDSPLCINNEYYSRTEDAIPEPSQQVCILQPARQVIKINDLSPYTSSSHKTSHKHELSSKPNSTKIIPFGDLNYSLPIGTDDHHQNQNNWASEMNFSSVPVSWESIPFENTYESPEFGNCVKTYEIETPHSALAERKRRQRLTHLFISLSAIIPGLKKLDKASILAGAMEYLKQLEQRIQVLEEEKEKRRKYEKSALVTYDLQSAESTLLVKSSPEVKVRTCNGNVLLRIYCRKRPRILNDILCGIEKLHLCLISTSVIPFGNTTLHITITAQESGEFCKRAEDVANAIRGSIL